MQRHSGPRGIRFLTNASPPPRSQNKPEGILLPKAQAEAVHGELPSSPVGPSIGFNSPGFGGGGGSGIRDAVLTTVFGVAVRELCATQSYSKLI